MKYLFINVVSGIRSTGRICTDLALKAIEEGHTVIIAYGREDVPEQFMDISHRIGSDFLCYKNAIESRIFDNDGFTAKRETEEFLEWAEEYNPDILWLHNLHGYYINVELLFSWIKTRPQMIVKWTLHDCWAFTGHCAYFSYVKCDKWKTQCHSCEQKVSYPTSYICDRSKTNYCQKKELFSGVSNMSLITPSYWLSDLVSKSFLKEYPVSVIHNTIDESVFKPTYSDLKSQLGFADKRIVLGVAAKWDRRKGYDDFLKLAEMLSDDYQIILIGLDKRQFSNLPSNITGLGKTNSAKELAMYYTMADVFFNPTYEDNYPTTNLEAKACGTIVITYNTGGSPESVDPSLVFEQGDVQSVARTIMRLG